MIKKCISALKAEFFRAENLLCASDKQNSVLFQAARHFHIQLFFCFFSKINKDVAADDQIKILFIAVGEQVVPLKPDVF